MIYINNGLSNTSSLRSSHASNPFRIFLVVEGTSCFSITRRFPGLAVQGNIEGSWVLHILSPSGKWSPQILVCCAFSFKFSFRMSFSYKRLTLASLGKVWNFFSGEFLQLFVHPGTQQLNLPILHLTPTTKTQGNEEFKQMASPKTAPWRFATPNLTQSPAQPRNGQWWYP